MPQRTYKSSLFNDAASTGDAPAAVTEDPAAEGDDVSRFEAALSELEGIVERMERGDLALAESLQLFERGMGLTRQCRTSLETAELKVRDLLAADGSGDEA
jgi:exodeoxyribonuclease VII small subunit